MSCGYVVDLPGVAQVQFWQPKWPHSEKKTCHLTIPLIMEQKNAEFIKKMHYYFPSFHWSKKWCSGLFWTKREVADLKERQKTTAMDTPPASCCRLPIRPVLPPAQGPGALACPCPPSNLRPHGQMACPSAQKPQGCAAHLLSEAFLLRGSSLPLVLLCRFRRSRLLSVFLRSTGVPSGVII